MIKRSDQWICCIPAFFFMASAAASAADMSPLKEVHEWGTMTSVAGSDGRQFAWWGLDINRLTKPAAEQVPEFVQTNPLGGKASFAYVQRMETPVLYFYPTKPLPVEVTVQFKMGRITEFFPSLGERSREDLDTEKASGPITWKLDLLSPSDKAGTLLPKIGKEGAQYVHAREVPAAWLVRRELSLLERKELTEAKVPKQDEVEKFLFYRGASDVTTLVSAWQNEKSFQLMSFFPPLSDGKDPIPAWWILKVSGGLAAWSRVPVPVAKIKNEFPSAKVDIPELPQKGSASNLETVASEMRAEMLPVLIKAGLSGDEAKAMLSTWNDTWFKEPGTRLLFLLPQKWVDQVLPLTIKPAPQKISRVFMARVEMISPGQEKVLLDALNQAARDQGVGDDPAQIKRIRDLELGRFIGAGFQRAINMQESDMENAAWYLKMRMEK